jgi:hypothetical protein
MAPITLPPENGVFEYLGGAAELGRGARLGFGDAGRRKLRVLEPMQHDEVGAGIDDGDRDTPVVFGSFGLGGGHCLSGVVDRDRRAIRCVWRGNLLSMVLFLEAVVTVCRGGSAGRLGVSVAAANLPRPNGQQGDQCAPTELPDCGHDAICGDI